MNESTESVVPVVPVEPVVREVLVAAPATTCFTVFVERFAEWWPPEHHIGEGRTIESLAIEPFVGGRCYDVDTAGGACQWGTVLELDRPRRFVLAWHIQGDWTIDPDPARQSEVVITFEPVDADTTSVRLEHRHLERHGAGGHDLQSGVSGEGGWTVLLHRFADLAEGRAPRALPPHPVGSQGAS